MVTDAKRTPFEMARTRYTYWMTAVLWCYIVKVEEEEKEDTVHDNIEKLHETLIDQERLAAHWEGHGVC
jgi:hypothetical protein